MNLIACKPLPVTSGKFFMFSDGTPFVTDLVFGLTAQIKVRVPQLDRRLEMVLRKICGDDYWLHCLEYAPTEAGECALRLCADGYVPLIDTGKRNSANHHLYIAM